MTKFVLILFIFFSGLNFVLAAEISQFVFTPTPQTIEPNTISEKINIQAQNTEGKPVSVPQTTCVELKTTPNLGEFSSNNVTWKAINKLTISNGDTQRGFYYKYSSAGNYIITANIALKPTTETKSCVDWLVENWDIQWTAKQDIVISSSGGGDTISVSTSTSGVDAAEPTPGVGSASWPVEPQIYANAGPDKTVVVGADVYFSGQALGIKKEPLENARYLWNFGDGAIAENQNVKHIYMYPGEYIAVLDVASGQYSASDNLLVKVIPNQIKISEANKDFIKLSNGSNVTLDLSGWFIKLRNSSNFFKLPASTMIRANSNLTIPCSNSGIKVDDLNVVELLYPNSSLAFSWQKPSDNNVKHVESPISNTSSNEIIVQIQTTTTPTTTQTASVINVSQEQEDFWSEKKWLILVIILGIISSIGLLFVRHKYEKV